MAVVILKEVNRLPGLVPEGDLIAGQITQVGTASNKIKAYASTGATAAEALGMALETTTAFTSLSSIPTFKLNDDRGLNDPTKRPTSDRPSGDLVVTGTFYDQVNRGGLVSVLLNGAEVDLYDDGRGAPYETAPTTPYALMGVLYADQATGKVTSDAANGGDANKPVGVCLKVPTGGEAVLRMRLDI